ncbi:hypothetical protein ABMA27_014254 [Loxostege sticticalis]|uniref:RNA-directed DNA polymerase n=1 Tax=Loxostege sticticalis TaxID=481309 RepID=A0ABR3ID95_LOXSC
MSVHLSDEQFQLLFAKLSPNRRGSFAFCTSHFEGEKNSEAVEAFLAATSIYKSIENIPDKEALDGVPLLLRGEAAIWWQGVKKHVTSWEQFGTRLRNAFAPKKPAYILYQEIIGEKQEANVPTEQFIAHKRMLFSQLPAPEHTEEQQLSMIFVKTYDELLTAARGIEDLRNDNKVVPEPSLPKPPPRRGKCSYCHFVGHSMQDCRKLKRKQAEPGQFADEDRDYELFQEDFVHFSSPSQRQVCIDYRRLNATLTPTVPDTYPIPRIDDLLHAAKPTPFMTSLDLKSGYWQIKMREEDEDKTAFITPFGIYKFKRMPFGLIDRFHITSLQHIKLLAYLDDLVIFSTSYENHLSDLRDFCLPSIKYLGHLKTPQGLQMDPEKTKAIVDQPAPQNLKQLISFLLICSWYRRFIENFSAVAEPLNLYVILTQLIVGYGRSKRYYWSGMRKYIESYVRKCVDCQRFKPSNQKPAGLLQTTIMNQRFEIIAFDLRDGPYMITRQHGPASYEVASPNAPDKPIGVYHSSALTAFRNNDEVPLPQPVKPLRKRGRPKKTVVTQSTQNPSRRGRGRPRK